MFCIVHLQIFPILRFSLRFGLETFELDDAVELYHLEARYCDYRCVSVFVTLAIAF